MSSGGYQPPGAENAPPPATDNTTSNEETGSVSSSSQIVSMAIQHQDSMIDELAVGISRLRDQSHAINDEANLQVNLLNDMESNIDTAHDQLGNQAQRARALYDEIALWKLQLMVAGLTISFFLLLVLRWM